MVDRSASRSQTDRASPSLAELIRATGTPAFGHRLADYLSQGCGADHCTLFGLAPDSARELASGSRDGTDIAHRRATAYLAQRYWHRDPAMQEAQRCDHSAAPMLIKVDIETMGDTAFRDAMYPSIRERLVLACRTERSLLGLSLLRQQSQAPFSNVQLQWLSDQGEIIAALLSKHADMALGASPTRALSCVRQIEECLTAATNLPRRELEVCARAIRGLTTTGMSIELGIGVESVKTYRKRAYQRLRIGSERELTAWYLALWERWRGEAGLH